MCQQKKEYLVSLAVVLMMVIFAIIMVRFNSDKAQIAPEELAKMEKTTNK
ncbi:MAG: hypothetical protein WCL61_03375 [bacterium]